MDQAITHEQPIYGDSARFNEVPEPYLAKVDPSLAGKRKTFAVARRTVVAFYAGNAPHARRLGQVFVADGEELSADQVKPFRGLAKSGGFQLRATIVGEEVLRPTKGWRRA